MSYSSESNRSVGLMTEKKFNWLLDAPSQGPGKIQTTNEARDFIAFILTSPDKLEIASRLTSSEYGLNALLEAFSVENTLKFIKQSVIPFIRFIGSDDRLCASTTKLLRTIFTAPDLFPELVECVIDRKLSQEECSEIALLALQVVKGGDDFSLEAKRDQNVLRLARALSMPGEYAMAKAISDQINTLLEEVQHEPGMEVVDIFDQDFSAPVESSKSAHPGWRHSNDKVDFRSILLYPTVDELTCDEEPFLPRTFDVLEKKEPRKLSAYLDWAFRLLREDVNQVVKEELRTIMPMKDDLKNVNPRLATRLRNRTLDVIKFSDISCNQRFGVGFKMQFKEPHILLNLLKPAKSQQEIEKTKQEFWDDRANFLKAQSILAFFRNNGTELVGLGIVNVRDLLELVKDPPSIDVSLFDKKGVRRTVVELGSDQRDLKIVQLSASFFAFTPILERLKMLSAIPFENEILHGGKVESPSYFNANLEVVVQQLESADPRTNLAPVLGVKNRLNLDPSQKKAVISSLQRRVALVQGPPGTGKSYCGAMISKIIYDKSTETILCVTYTNHALDQFLENLIDFGLPTDQIVRIGGADKISDRIKPFALFNLLKGQQRDSSRIVRNLRDRMNHLCNVINKLKEWVQYLNVTLEMKDFAPVFTDQLCDAFQVPTNECQNVGPDYLWQQWIHGQDRGLLKSLMRDQFGSVWLLVSDDRQKKIANWRQQLIEPYIEQLTKEMVRYNELSDELNELYQIAEIQLLKSKRIIGCTTTGAAKYATKLDAVSAGVLIMEEAGEILEPHVITSLAANCKHLVMIGDHKQLRPKLNNFNLSVESTGPFKFNRSLFERLVVTNNVPHVTLQLQHRMGPEISDLVRLLTYPELKDADGVKNRPNIRGLSSNVVFIQHDHLEGSDDESFPNNRQTGDDSLSKINHYEVGMVAKIAEFFLVKQGYQSSQIVVLTPYLGQLNALRKEMSKMYQVVLSDLDQADLNRFGLEQQELSPTARKTRPAIRISTVDNFQGEEGDIVIASLVRSNSEGNIGFVGQPERVNVLLSRARNGLVLLGNGQTFEQCRSAKGRELWAKLLGMLRDKQAIYPIGFPAYCNVHDRTFYLDSPTMFDKLLNEGFQCDLDRK